MSKISKYLNQNQYHFPKLKGNSVTKIEKRPLLALNKFFLPQNNNDSQEKNLISNKERFKFNNQKIFSFLLNDKYSDSTTEINLTTKNDKYITSSCEKDKDSIINDNVKIINDNKIKKGKVYPSLINDYSKERKKYIKTSVEEDYKNIFLIDCLCLDKWEEKNNKFRKKNKSKLKGKKIFLYQ